MDGYMDWRHTRKSERTGKWRIYDTRVIAVVKAYLSFHRLDDGVGLPDLAYVNPVFLKNSDARLNFIKLQQFYFNFFIGFLQNFSILIHQNIVVVVVEQLNMSDYRQFIFNICAVLDNDITGLDISETV